ncbi:GNAT family N-acetyltransferase [Commensalibacter papalotli (ex Botero et al. 2024)]|uniref:RimJ/RimL family (RimL) (PDB:1S7F) n=1 Tax=Commensalibacter papalotli (ex Botero et al. 2024) TaxID=2972766 RepID=A0ABM9HKA5_9PROT|nr:GNAT family N-acetyltransferase [Commensalibacter papalotli (ex Botero et al. 2024)]CAI3930246.1 Protein N-acetyltransferase [Commensalibacter papalotli (ex Botero et al. 2024)]CAI3948393.1 Protein N-acetyltransferase [Commensalibacter papalotli (ex Botero et al. 2024)]
MISSLIYTPRLILSPIGWADIEDVTALKTDSQAFGHMLGGVRTSLKVAIEMGEDTVYWGCHRIGMYVVRENIKFGHSRFLGITGIHNRPDGRGYALRFSLWPWAQGRGYAREAAYAVLTEAHARGHDRIVAVAKEDNIPSRRVLGGIGMVVEDVFFRHENKMIMYVSTQITL